PNLRTALGAYGIGASDGPTTRRISQCWECTLLRSDEENAHGRTRPTVASPGRERIRLNRERGQTSVLSVSSTLPNIVARGDRPYRRYAWRYRGRIAPSYRRGSDIASREFEAIRRGRDRARRA